MKILKKAFVLLFTLALLVVPTMPALADGLSVPAPTTGEYTCPRDANQAACLKNNPIVKWLNFFINLFAAIVFVGATAMMIYAGIQYATSADNPQRVQAAKQQILNVIIGLVAFFFLYAFMQWLIPGGVF